MNLSQLLDTDERGVSPVIGVILMVAITVILAAVIGTFVLGLGDQVQETAPTAQFSWSEDLDEDPSEVTVTHETGDSVQASQINITVDGIIIDETDVEGLDESISAGSQVTIPEDVEEAGSGTDTPFSDGGATVRLVWETQGGERSSTLTSYTVSDDFDPDA